MIMSANDSASRATIDLPWVWIDAGDLGADVGQQPATYRGREPPADLHDAQARQ
jgi:hypothetical protein